jgi:hypothetical protein
MQYTTARRGLSYATWSFCLIGLLALGTGTGEAQPPESNPDQLGGQLRCSELEIPVALAPGQSEDYTVIAWLCSRGPLEHKTIQVLLHGATNDHTYWDWPYQPDHYSYVRAATAAGYATLNMDRVGFGLSSHVPDGLDLDLGADAYAAHEIIQDLRSGALVVHGFGRVRAERILLAGESLAANIAWLEAGTYHDVDGLLVAGSSHTFASGFQDVISDSIPTQLDPVLGQQDWPPDYFTTAPGTRGFLFYYSPDADPQVIALDEASKGTVALGEEISTDASLPVSAQVDVPTLITIGDFDHLFCEAPSCSVAGTQAHELDHWGSESCAQLAIIPNAGHALNLHLDAPDYFALVNAWADRWVGASTKSPPPERCPHE